MDTKFRSNYSEDEQIECMKQYLNGCDKEQLSKLWGISIRTIERWIKNWTDKDSIDVRIAKRSKKIPIDIQKKLMQILTKNAMLYGFNVSTWDEVRVIKLLNNNYNIKITRYMAKALLSDSKNFSEKYKEKVINEIAELEQLGYKLVFVDYIQIGRIDKEEIEPLAYKKFKEYILKVNLAIAMGAKSLYKDILFSETDIIGKQIKSIKLKKVDSISKERNQRKVIINDKYNFISKIANKEDTKSKIVFISKNDKDIEQFSKKIMFYIVDKDLYEQLLCNKHRKIYQAMKFVCDHNNKYRKFTSLTEVQNFIKLKEKEFAKIRK